MIAIVWRFTSAGGAQAAFEDAYGSDGAWAKLFRTAPGYVRTDLLRRFDGSYLTIDYWHSLSDWDAFSRGQSEAYAALDAACEALTASEEQIGVFEVVEPR